ncbi:MAG TPA: restriction endonuclease [Pyrinomonadaceae bacterium]|nr:restriction endonuclease [Pyrinomonadaceae bacterium]
MKFFSRKKINTTKKGNDFEARVYKVIETELKTGKLGLIPECAQLFAKKPYYSRDRNANIVVDLSIEVTIPGKDTYSFLWVLECKDYAGKIPIDDLEEFHAKVQQIAGDNVKATFVTNAAFSKSGLNYAKANGIGLIRLLPENQVEWFVMWRSELTAEQIWKEEYDRLLQEIEPALTLTEFCTHNRFFHGYIDNKAYLNFNSFIEDIIHSEMAKNSDLKNKKGSTQEN